MKGAPRQLRVALMLAATVALLFALLIYLLYAANLIAFPYDYDQGEGFELHDTVLFSQFQLPYRDTERYPFYASNYPPLFHMMAAPFVWLFGPSYWYGRLLGFLASLVSAAAIAYAVYRDGERQRWIALLAGLAFLSSNFVYHIGPLFRQHTMMVTFETLAVVMLAGAFPTARQARHRRRSRSCSSAPATPNNSPPSRPPRLWHGCSCGRQCARFVGRLFSP